VNVLKKLAFEEPISSGGCSAIGASLKFLISGSSDALSAAKAMEVKNAHTWN
jgi:hypothetical protein